MVGEFFIDSNKLIAFLEKLVEEDKDSIDYEVGSIPKDSALKVVWYKPI